VLELPASFVGRLASRLRRTIVKISWKLKGWLYWCCFFSLVSDFVLVFCLTAFEKALILLYVERKQKKKDRDRVSWIVFLHSMLLFSPGACTHQLFIFIFFQLSSVSSVDEIKFKTIIPASSLVIRDHCWLNDGTPNILLSIQYFIKVACLLDSTFPVH